MNKDLSLLKQLASELLSQAEDCGDYLATSATLVADDVEMLKRLEAFCKEPRLWVVHENEVIDCEVQNNDVHIFFDRDSALDCYKKAAWLAEHDFTPQGWSKDEYDNMDGQQLYFEMWDEKESFVSNHYTVSLFCKLAEI